MTWGTPDSESAQAATTPEEGDGGRTGMGDAFVAAFAEELARTQRALPVGGLLCVPQPRSLLAGVPVTQEDLYAHFLAPVGFADGSGDGVDRRLGQYETLNGRTVSIEGSHVRAGAGFGDRRKVRILLSEQREVHRQRVTVLHLSRPLSGGVELPEDPNELDVATFRRLTAILRAFPENELVFYQLDDAIRQVREVCMQAYAYKQYEDELPGILQGEWESAVDELINAGSFDDEDEAGRGSSQRHRGGVGHLLQIQQVVECYLMEELHDFVFPRIAESCRDEDARLAQIMYRMRHYTPADFGIRKEFQCFAAEAKDALLDVRNKKTPLDMLLALKACIDRISDAITHNVKLRRLDFERYQLTTDDILDQLLYVMVQVFNCVAPRTEGADDMVPVPVRPLFPIAAMLRYISDFHFINSNTTALGFTIANFQVAVEFFLMKDSDGEQMAPGKTDGDTSASLLSVQAISPSKCEQTVEQNRQAIAQFEDLLLQRSAKQMLAESTRSSSSDRQRDATDPRSTASLVIIGDWSVDENLENDEKQTPTSGSVPYRYVSIERNGESNSSERNFTQVSVGRRFFAAVDENGRVFTWGDSSGSRLGYSIPIGHSRRISRPQLVLTLSKQHIVHVSCGAFHALATDINGHVFAWGSNSQGQLGFAVDSELQTADASPRMVGDLCGVFMSAVACGENHSLGLSSSGDVYSWGSNRYGQLGRVTRTPFDAAQPSVLRVNWTGRCSDLRHIRSPRAVGVRRIAAGKDHSLAVTNDGAVFTWGRGDAGQLGHGCFMDVSYPKQVMALAPLSRRDETPWRIIEAAGGGEFSLFLTEKRGFTYICGRDPSLALDHELLLSPVLLTVSPSLQDEGFGSEITGISCGDTHYCLVTKRGALAVSKYYHQTNDGDSSAGVDGVDGVDGESGQGAATAGSATTERQERRLDVLEVGHIVAASAGGSHTLALVQ